MAKLTDRQRKIGTLAKTWLRRPKPFYREMLKDELDAGRVGGKALWALPRGGDDTSFMAAVRAWAALVA